jgi:predicted nucleic acid-binding protein
MRVVLDTNILVSALIAPAADRKRGRSVHGKG